jgi:nucleoside 2-deoxyribosyltransferase
MKKKKIYLAGFDVFYTNALAILNKKKELCAEYGFIGLAPLDNEVDFSLAKEELRRVIYEANIELIKESDILAVNLNAFRHGEPDAGTVFEIGYGVALGKEVYVYVDSTESMLEKTKACDENCQQEEGIWLDGQGLMIEDFEGMFNLMITESTTIINGNLQNVLEQIK